MIRPYDSNLAYDAASLGGRMPCSTLLPSNGGMGIRLKTASITFTHMLASNTISRGTETYAGMSACKTRMDLSAMPLASASRKFAPGPASATQSMSCFGFLKYLGFTGIGFAHPIFMMKKQITPMGSRCFRGFRVRRPIRDAVGSPSRFAT